MSSNVDEKVGAGGSAVHDNDPSTYVGKSEEMAKEAADEELRIIFREEAIHRYPRAAMWSILLSSSIVMEGYDIVLTSSFLAQPSFSRRYGNYIPATGSY